MRPRIIFLNRFFFPDHSASSQLLSDLAFHLAHQGEDVHVITSRETHHEPDAPLPSEARMGGVEIHRIWTSHYGSKSLTRRALDFLSFHALSSVKLATLARRGDVVVANTDPPMLSLVTSSLSGLKRFKTINWLHDIYPEVAAEVGIPVTRGPVGKTLVRLRNRSLRRAHMNVAIGEEMAKRVLAFGVRSQAVRVIQNWSDDLPMVTPAEGPHPLRKEWSLADKFVVGYSGNLGRAHEVETILGAAELLKHRDDIVFLFIGGGYRFAEVEAQAKLRGLPNFMFKPYQPRETLPLSLSVSDVHWLSLRPELRGLVVPSKFYGMAAARRPIIVVTSPDGELGQLVTDHKCGFAVQTGDPEGLTRGILGLAANRPLCREMGLNARRMLDTHFTKAQALQRWTDVIGEVTAERAAPVVRKRRLLASAKLAPGSVARERPIVQARPSLTQVQSDSVKT